MKAFFSTKFEDFRRERPFMILLTLTETDIRRQSKFTYQEINILKNVALEKLH